ncbi:DNA methyltransferase [Balneolaceae bacterium ANBcel3]|nr:DNA methyltransferase [Balneolaceae bacterium ANBcel3]
MSKFYTIENISETLGVTRQTITKYIKEEKLNAVRLGKAYRIHETDFVNFINANSIISDNVIDYKAINYNGFSFLNKIHSNNHNGDYRLEPLELNHKDAYNTFFWGDNIYVLQQLLPKIRSKVDLIYIDPPFGTGQIFSDMDKIEAYDDTLINADFLGFLRDRLYLLKECLSKNGSIYLHIDKKIGHYVKVIMDEVFGHRNFINDITRIKCNPKNFSRKAYGNQSDMILFYAKNRDHQIWNELKEPLEEEEVSVLFQKKHKTKGRYTTHPIHAPGETIDGDTGQEWKGLKPPKGRHWRYSREELTRLDNAGLIEWSSKGNPRKIVFANNHEGKKIQDVWEFKDLGKSFVNYPTQKNHDLLERIILNSSNVDSLVLDCFAGSGGTIVTANKFHRKWIGIDSSDYSLRTIKETFNKSGVAVNYVALVKG